MKVRDYQNEVGETVGFELGHAFVSRRGAHRIVETISGVTISTRRPSPVLGWFGDDVFCEFQVGAVRFVVEEPFGDSDAFMVHPVPARPVPELAIVREAFVRAPSWRFLF